MRSSIRFLLALAACEVAASPTLCAQAAPTFDRRELVIPMRDGVRLAAVALVPASMSGPLPIILIRTPFGAAREFRGTDLPLSLRELAEDRYIFVAQDVRGRGGSGGNFITLRPPANPEGARGVDESTDAWDTVEWLVRNMAGNNGKVGIVGTSYRGWLAGMAALDPHPAVKAISPQGLMTDIWLGDDIFHQGAFRQTQAVLYSAYIEGSGELVIPEYDQYQYFLRLATLAAIGKATGVDTLPMWRSAREHPAYDAFWRARGLQHHLTRSTVPTLFVGGWWDEEDILGPQLAYQTLERNDAKGLNRLAMGPWSHNGWIRGSGDSLGPFALGSRTAEYFRSSIQRPWFAHYLHGAGPGAFPEAWAFENGSNTWRTFDAWPPANAQRRRLYLRENHSLSFAAPKQAGSRAFDEYRADPAHPVPNTPRPDDGSAGATWLQQDQRFVDGRPDVLTWMTAPLEDDITIAGDVIARLFASTTGSDADWVVKLIDVHPDQVEANPAMGGYQRIVNADIMRGRYWKGFDRPSPIPANTVVPFTVDLHQQLYRFVKGHRIMVQVQSSWFPLYDRNPQRFVANIFHAAPGDFRKADHRIWRSARFPSHIEVGVLPN